MLGALLALAAAASFGLNSAATRRGVLRGSVLQGMAITVPFGVPVFLVFALAMGGFGAMAAWRTEVWVWMALAGVVHFVVGRYGNYRATKALGATLSTPVQQVSILVALVLAFVFLDETINAVNLVGILLIVAGPMVLVRRRGAVRSAARGKAFEPDFVPGLLWGAVAALGYGTSPLFIALALRNGGTLADSVAGGLVSYVTATGVVAILLIGAGGRGYVAGLDRESRNWFLLSALFVALSQVFRYLAMALAPVSVVVPIQRLSVVFRLIFGALINRDHEVFDLWVVLSILLAVAGSVAVAAETGALLAWIGLGDRGWLAAPLF